MKILNFKLVRKLKLIIKWNRNGYLFGKNFISIATSYYIKLLVD